MATFDEWLKSKPGRYEQWEETDAPENAARFVQQYQTETGDKTFQSVGKLDASMGGNNIVAGNGGVLYEIDPTGQGALPDAITKNLVTQGGKSYVSPDVYNAEMAKLNTNDKFSNFMNKAPGLMAGAFLGATAAPALMGAAGVTNPIAQQALFGAAKSAISGGNPLTGAVTGVVGGQVGQVFGGDSFAGANDADLAMDVGSETFVDPWGVMGDPNAYGLSGTTGADIGTTSFTVGDGQTAAEALYGGATPAATPEVAAGAAPSTPIETAVTAPQAADIGAQQAIDGSAQTLYDTAAQAGVTGYDAALASAPEPIGYIDKILEWAKGNQGLAAAGVTTAGGLLRGAMEQSPEQKAAALMQAKTQADAAALANRQASNRLGNVNVRRLAPTGATLQRPGIIRQALQR